LTYLTLLLHCSVVLEAVNTSFQRLDLHMSESEEEEEKYPNLVGLFERASFYCSSMLSPS